MNTRMLARAGSLALIVLSTTSTATDCERRNAEYSASSRSEYQVDVQADDSACWRVSMDGDDTSGCGDVTLYGYDSPHQVEVRKTRGKGSVRVTLRSRYRTRDRQTVRDVGDRARLYDDTGDSDWRDRNDRNRRDRNDSDWRDRNDKDDKNNDKDDKDDDHENENRDDNRNDGNDRSA